MSLIEGNDDKTAILVRIKRALPISILKNNLIRIFELHNKLYFGEYSDLCLKHFEDKFDLSQSPEQAEFIMETGFNIYILMNFLMKIEVDNEEENEDDEDIEKILNEQKITKYNRFSLKNNIFGEFSALGRNLFQAGKGYWSQIKKKFIANKVDKESNDMLKKHFRKAEQKQNLRDALLFFSRHVSHIEICMKEKMQKIFFPILPMCKMLPKEIKENFNENVNRINTKIKVEELMATAPYFIKIMRHEEKLRVFFNKNKMIGILVNREKLWKQVAFYINILINLTIIVSYTDKFVPKDATPAQRQHIRLYQPYFFEKKEFNQTLNVILGLGLVNLIMGSMVVALFLIKKGPLIIGQLWRGFFAQKMPLFSRIYHFVMKIFTSFFILLNDLEFLYYVIYTIMIISGLAIHPFFFVFNLTDFLRIDELKNVVKAIWLPRKQLLLALFLLILSEYYFAIIGYVVFYSQFGGQCNRLWVCMFTSFDKNFNFFFFFKKKKKKKNF